MKITSLSKINVKLSLTQAPKLIVALLVMVICAMSTSAQAFLVESGYTQQNNGSYVKATRVSCDVADKDSCLQLCQKEAECQRIEPYCRNCAGTSSSLLRQLFTDIARLYKIKNQVQDSQEILRFLGDEQYVLLDGKSIFNYYTPIGGEGLNQDLLSFCGAGADKALLAVTLDASHVPQELKYVLCKDNKNQTIAFEVEGREPHMGAKPLSVSIKFELN